MAYDAATIQSMYDQTLAAQQAQKKAAYDQAVAEYQKQIADAAPQYQTLRNQAYTNQAMQERIRQENMANMGLSAVGGTSQTLEQRNRNQLLNTLGDTNRQQQGYADNVNLALSNLGTQYNADLASLMAETNANRNNALMQQSQWQTAQDQWQKEFDASQQSTSYSQAINLYSNGLITKDQFKAMTGIDVQDIPRSSGSGGGGGGGGGGSALKDFQYLISMGFSTADAENLSGYKVPTIKSNNTVSDIYNGLINAGYDAITAKKYSGYSPTTNNKTSSSIYTNSRKYSRG